MGCLPRVGSAIVRITRTVEGYSCESPKLRLLSEVVLEALDVFRCLRGGILSFTDVGGWGRGSDGVGEGVGGGGVGPSEELDGMMIGCG